MRILVTGITGAVGSALAPKLLEAGHELRALSRREPVAGELSGEVELLRGDAVSGVGLDRALAGVDVAYYLIHSMETAGPVGFELRERQSAENFAFAARMAGVRRVIYLGGPVPAAGAQVSEHLASRLAVEQRLLEATPEAVAFRAAIVIGASSRSFRFLVRLIERMPVMLLPSWRKYRTAPIDERDVTAFLAAAASAPIQGGTSLDIAGPELVTYQELIERIRDHMLLLRPALRFPGPPLTPIAARIAALIAGEDPSFISPLMDSLNNDLLARDDRAAEIFGVRRHSLDAAIEAALRRWEQSEPLAAR
ncbi:MAG: NAD(P)H-binding protein [Solirubrobacterales bacterium]|nr:NAD(P)H-binding protein [Solirubrobacterales bacterium]